MIILGAAFTIIMLMFARPIITILKWDPKSYYSFLAIAIAPIFVSIMCTFRGFFQGLQNVRPTAISQIVEQVGRVVAGVLFAYLLFPKGIEYAAGGAALGTLVGAIMGSIYLVSTYFKVKKEFPVRKKTKHKHILSDLAKSCISDIFRRCSRDYYVINRFYTSTTATSKSRIYANTISSDVWPIDWKGVYIDECTFSAFCGSVRISGAYNCRSLLFR